MTEMMYDDIPTKPFDQMWAEHWHRNGRRYLMATILLVEVLVGILVAYMTGG